MLRTLPFDSHGSIASAAGMYIMTPIGIGQHRASCALYFSMLRLALSDLSDWRLRSIRFKTELTSPALCAFGGAWGADHEALASTTNNKT